MALFNRNRGAEKAEMTFIDHLEELRVHIIRSVLAILIMATFIFIYRNWIFDYIVTGPINPDFISYRVLCRFSHWAHMGDALCMPPVKVNMQSNTFGGQFLGSISMALVGGIILAFPYIFLEFWRFVKPALKEKETKNTKFVIFWVSFFFFCGAAFGFLLLGPFDFTTFDNRLFFLCLFVSLLIPYRNLSLLIDTTISTFHSHKLGPSSCLQNLPKL